MLRMFVLAFPGARTLMSIHSYCRWQLLIIVLWILNLFSLDSLGASKNDKGWERQLDDNVQEKTPQPYDCTENECISPPLEKIAIAKSIWGKPDLLAPVITQAAIEKKRSTAVLKMAMRCMTLSSPSPFEDGNDTFISQPANAPFIPRSMLPEHRPQKTLVSSEEKPVTPASGARPSIPVSRNPAYASHPKKLDKKELSAAFDFLKSSQPKKAEQIFRKFLNHVQFRDTAIVGLARSLLKQGDQYCREAEKILRDLKNKSKNRKVGDEVLSETPGLDMGLVRALEASGKWVSAQKLLQAMARDHKRDLAPDDWSSPCDNHTIDIARVRLQEERGDYKTAGALLQAMARDHKRDLALNDWSSPCDNHTIDLTRVRLLQERGDYEPAGQLLQAMARDHKRDPLMTGPAPVAITPLILPGFDCFRREGITNRPVTCCRPWPGITRET